MRRVITALLVAGVLAGCSNVEPWVKPYERANLATEIMKFEEPFPLERTDDIGIKLDKISTEGSFLARKSFCSSFSSSICAPA